MHARAIQHLRTRDPRLAEWIERLGPVKLAARRSREPFLALLETVAHQQLAGAAAKAIWTRVVGLFPAGGLCPEALLSLSDDHLRSAGLSKAKAAAMREIAARTLAGEVPNAQSIGQLSEREIIAQLTRIRGIGPWTVDMLLIFTLRRPDILPVGDYGVRKGFQVLVRKRALPTPAQLVKAAELWRPYRTTASLYLWRIADQPKKKTPTSHEPIS